MGGWFLTMVWVAASGLRITHEYGHGTEHVSQCWELAVFIAETSPPANMALDQIKCEYSWSHNRPQSK